MSQGLGKSRVVDYHYGMDKQAKFLKEHHLGVLSTIDRAGSVHGAVVYYFVDERSSIYILTKSGTAKGHNIFSHPQVALTIYENATKQTLQLQGTAELEANQAVKDQVFARLSNPHLYDGKISNPPVTSLHKGSFMVIRITPTNMSFHDYSEQDS